MEDGDGRGVKVWDCEMDGVSFVDHIFRYIITYRQVDVLLCGESSHTIFNLFTGQYLITLTDNKLQPCTHFHHTLDTNVSEKSHR